ncbi:multicopper oxidase family protein [Actinopolymorpha alba]|uniref:multicopper oxidase family protein n=1 Tax=Actinopolymorpha alba TaxID=533267 RepID=UPI00037FE2B8|nr:multicopper oxidase family protein [Actinopolymorpha alba]
MTEQRHSPGRLSRRQTLRVLGAGVLLPWVASSCSLLRSSTPDARLLASTAPLPKPFQVPLPIPDVLKPTSTSPTTDYYDLPVRVAEQEILPGLRTRIWGYAGQFPGPTLEARRGRRIVVRQRNELPVPVVTHLHGGRTPPESDGYPTDLLLPARGDFPSGMPDPRAKVVRGQRTYEFPLDQRAATLWYHDHRMDFTGPQVWRGLAGFFVVRDDEDDALPLPKGAKDVPLMICDRAFAADGSLSYPALDASLRSRPGVREAYAGGVLGDVILVNGAPWPEFEVARTRYRFRVLNASNARRYELALDPAPSESSAFVQVGTDGGLLERPATRETLTLAPAERLDVVVDFAAYPVGTTIVLRNRAGKDSAAQVMRFRVVRNERDDSAVPNRLSRIERLDPARAKVTRDLRFESGEVHGHTGWTINGKAFDPTRMDARPKLGSTEIWRLTSDIAHPVHLHLVHFQVLSIDGRKVRDLAWKDTHDLQAAQTVEVIARFDGYRGRYAFHCHNLEHEDMAMMGNFEVV